MLDMEIKEKNIEAVRQFLTTSLETSMSIDSTLNECGSRLELLNKGCFSMQASLRPISMHKYSFVDVEHSIDSVLCSASAVLKVFDSVHQLEHSLLTDQSSDICTYVSDTKKLEEALKLLTDNCRLATCWLNSIFEFLQDKAIPNEAYLLQVNKSMRILQELEAKEECARLDGGLLSTALDKLEIAFHRLLMTNSMPIPLVSLTSHVTGFDEKVLPFPSSLTRKLQVITERLDANNRLDKCQSMYVEVRGKNARRSLKTLDLSYLEVPFPTDEFEDKQGNIESYIDQWGSHLDLVVKQLIEMEYMLSSIVFEKIGPEAWIDCFAKIAIESGILSFIQFGKVITERKNDPFKLLNLLSMFRVLNGLRLKFNQLFRGKACEEIRNVTKDLITRVVNGASEIFWQLPAQVKLQRPTSPPSDGSVPRLVSFVTDYCNHLLGDEYRPHLTKVLEIQLSWRKEAYEEGIVLTQIYSIIKEVAVNLDAWSKAYEDINMSYFFMMNNHCHFHNLKGSVLGNMMGDSWLKAHEQYKDYYAALYLRNSWGNIQHILVVQKDILSPSNGIVTSKDLAKRLNAFNLAFEERCKKQSKLVIHDEMLRENVCKHLVEGIVPIYKVYLKNYILSIESDAMVDKHIKYTTQSLQNKIWSLFQPQLRKHDGGIKHTDLISKIKEASHQFRLSLAAL